VVTATTNGVTETDTFDAAGNITSIGMGTSLTYGENGTPPNQLCTMTAGGVTTYFTFDANKRWRTAQGPSGNPGAVTYTYTGSGRLATYQDETRNLTATYAYDANGQRTHSDVVQTGQDTLTTDYLYEGITLESLSASKGPDGWKITYLYDETGTLYGGVYRSPASSTTPVFFGVVTTDRGDVVELLDAAGAPFAAYRYDPWGGPQGNGNVATGIWSQSTGLITSQTAADIASRQVLRYASYCYDSESGMYYLSARYYDPVTRQFLSKDPAKDDGEASAYQYCRGNPVGDIDPTGHATVASTYNLPAPKSTDALQITTSGNTVKIRWYCKITGDKMSSPIFGRLVIKNVIQSKWSGSYVIKGIPAWVNTTVTDLASGAPYYIPVGQKMSLVVFKYQTGTSGVTYPGGWSRAHPGTMSLYARDAAPTDYSLNWYRIVVAHEFGHILGIGDGRFNISTKSINSIMCDEFGKYYSPPWDPYRKATYKDIQKALSAYKYNTIQGWSCLDR
jgi:RHS repeat-associated protein